MIGVLSAIAILASLRVPRVFQAISDARINNAASTCNAVKAAVAAHRSDVESPVHVVGAISGKSSSQFPLRRGSGVWQNRVVPDAPLAECSVLVIDDESLFRRRLVAFLERAGADVTGVGDLGSARRALASMSFDFALVDVNLPDGLGTELLSEGGFPATTSVVIMTAEGGVNGAVEAMRLGAVDYLTKPFAPEELPLVFQRIRRTRQHARIEEHRREDESLRDDEFVFGSALAGLRAHLDRILAADERMQTGLAPVLVNGETGTGKTSIARWIHAHGPRAGLPLVEVNCSALPESLAESELFGHERGAFTDARTARLGLFEAANGGTLFLDELSSLSLPVQAKVLTVIEDQRVRRVGGNKAIPVDVRLITASNQDLRHLVNSGRFREDLYHRLDLFRLTIPPLRERPQDIMPLAGALVRRASRRHRLQAREISPVGRQRLEAHSWPGNVRELSHELERALVFEDGPLEFTLLPTANAAGTSPSHSRTEEAANNVPTLGSDSGRMAVAGDWFNDGYRFPSQGFSLESAVDRLVRHALAQTDGNVSAAARLLGVSRDVVRYRIEGRGSEARKLGHD